MIFIKKILIIWTFIVILTNDLTNWTLYWYYLLFCIMIKKFSFILKTYSTYFLNQDKKKKFQNIVRKKRKG